MRMIVNRLCFALLFVTASAAHAALPPDSLFRSISAREPYRTLLNTGRAARVDSMMLARLDAVIARGERDSLVIAQAIEDRVEAATMSGRAREPRTLALAERALAIHRAQPGPDSLFYARALIDIAEVRRRRTELSAALESFERGYRLRDRVLPADDPEMAGSALGVASVLFVDGHPAQAMPYVERALAIRRKQYGEDHVTVATVIYMRGGLKRQLGDLVGGYADMLQAADVFRRHYPPNHPDVLRTLDAIGVFAMDLGDYGAARQNYERALAGIEGASPYDSLAAAREFAHLLELHVITGDAEEAGAIGERAMHLQRLTRQPLTIDYATVQFDYGRALQLCGRDREAVAYFDSAFAMNQRVAPADTARQLPVLTQKAIALRGAGDLTGALAMTRRALGLRDEADAINADRAHLVQLEGDLLLDLGRTAEAVAPLDHARVLMTKSLGAGHRDLTTLLASRARAAIALHEPNAFALAAEVAARRTSELRETTRGVSEREALVYAQRQGQGLDALLTLAASGALTPAQRRTAFGAVCEARALVLDEIAGRLQQAWVQSAPAERALLDSLAQARAALAHDLMREEDDRDAGAGDSTRTALRQRVERLERGVAVLGTPAPKPADAATRAAEVAAALTPGEALVSYTRYRPQGASAAAPARMLAWVWRAGAGAPVVVPVGAQNATDDLVAAWRADVVRGTGADAERACRTSGAALRARVWDPLAAAIGDARRVSVVPEGALHLVDLAALPAPRGGWLIEQPRVIARLSAERELIERASEREGAGLLALGGADFEQNGGDALADARAYRGEPAACADFASVRFAPLPASKDEAGDVADAWRRARADSTLLLGGAAADEAAFKRLAPGKRAIHLATHGFFLGDDCGAASSTSRGIGGLAPARPVRTNRIVSPLRLAGLALAGANRRASVPAGAEDGVLTAQEIAALDLRGVREVVLSACDTGEGDIASGEGVLGLQRAFRIAGARTLVMSLWPVEDAATREWMRAYYGAWLGGEGAAQAVRAADLARLHALRAKGAATAPAAWAGFVASGRD